MHENQYVNEEPNPVTFSDVIGFSIVGVLIGLLGFIPAALVHSVAGLVKLPRPPFIITWGAWTAATGCWIWETIRSDSQPFDL